MRFEQRIMYFFKHLIPLVLFDISHVKMVITLYFHGLKSLCLPKSINTLSTDP